MYYKHYSKGNKVIYIDFSMRTYFSSLGCC